MSSLISSTILFAAAAISVVDAATLLGLGTIAVGVSLASLDLCASHRANHK